MFSYVCTCMQYIAAKERERGGTEHLLSPWAILRVRRWMMMMMMIKMGTFCFSFFFVVVISAHLSTPSAGSVCLMSIGDTHARIVVISHSRNQKWKWRKKNKSNFSRLLPIKFVPQKIALLTWCTRRIGVCMPNSRRCRPRSSSWQSRQDTLLGVDLQIFSSADSSNSSPPFFKSYYLLQKNRLLIEFRTFLLFRLILSLSRPSLAFHRRDLLTYVPMYVHTTYIGILLSSISSWLFILG